MDTTIKTTVNAGNVVTERIITDKCFNVQIKHETVRVLHYLGRLNFKRVIGKLRNINSRRPDAESL